MRYFRDNQEISRQQAFDCIKATAKHMFNADYNDSLCSGMYRDPKFNSIVCVDPVDNERFVVVAQSLDYRAPEVLVQGRLF